MVEHGYRYLWMFIVALAVASSTGCASAASGGHARTAPADLDAAIAAAITSRLADDEHLAGAAIHVSVAAGVAVLEGTAVTVDQVRRALRHAARIDGVRQVVNRLLVIERSGSGAAPIRVP